jgi:putative hydrolase of HD superfamily
MDKLIKFFILVGRLKFYQRRGWVLRGVQDSETVADHVYQLTLLAWIFSYGKNFKMRRLLKMALAHSLPAVDLQSITSYDHLLKVRSRKELLKKYPALVLRESLEKKEKIFQKRFSEEKRALEKFLKVYPGGFTDEIRNLWEDFRLGQSKEAQLLSSLDKLENLIQAIVYRGELGDEGLKPFWAQCYEVTDDKDLLEFIDSLNKFYKKGAKAVSNKDHLGIIKFLLKAAQLKAIKRKGWILRGVKRPSSIAAHSATAALMNWYFSKRKKLDQTTLFLMSLMHNIFAVETGDTTPHDIFIEKIKDIDKVVETFPWIGLKQEKEVLMKEALEKESKAVDDVIKYLPTRHRRELKYIWLEFKVGASKEGRFSRQVDRIETVIQAMEYHKQNKKISPTSFWLGLKELVDEPILLEFVENIDDYYFGRKPS